MKTDFTREIESALARDASIDEVVGILRAYRSRGMLAKAAAEALEDMRSNAAPHVEDQILEILDIVTGFCRPELRVWDEA